MAITRVGDQEAMPATATGAVDVTAPAGVANGDLLLHVFGMLNTTAVVTEPAGLTAEGSATSGTNLSARVRSRVSAPLMLIGIDAPLGAEWTAAVTDYPGIRYTRDFGKDNVYTPADADTLTEPTKYGTGKFSDLPSNAVMHLSWKDDPALLQQWLDSLPALPSSHPGFYISPWHEPRDEVDSGQFTTATFRAWGQQMSDIAAAHAKGYLIRGVGPVLTRYDLDERNANPADYGWPGMTFFGVDCYQDTPTAGSYYDTTKMFGTVFAKVQAAWPGIKLMVPEYGMVKLNSDTSGSARAAAITSHINYLKARGDVLAVAYFQSDGSIPGVPFAKTSPEADAWRAAQAAQAAQGAPGGASEPASYHWGTDATPKTGAWVGAYRGLDTVDPIADVQVVAGVSGTTQTTPAVAMPANGWLVYGVATRHTPAGVGVTTWTSSGIATELADLATNASAGATADLTMAVYDSGGPLTAGTPTRILTSSLAEGDAVVFAVALRPAAVTPPAASTDLVPGVPVF